MWHLTLYTFHRREGDHAGPLPGVWVGTAPKRAPRLRSQEVLLLYLSQQGNAPLDPKQTDQLLEALARRYFRERGSTTHALRSALDDLNTYLLQRNQRLSAEGQYALGRLAMVVWRDQRIVLGISGPLHAYLIGETVRYVHDPVLAGHGVGASRSPRIHFTSLEAVPYALLALAPEPLAVQPETLRFPPARRPDPFLRRLSADPRPELVALVAHMLPGAGEQRVVTLRARLKFDQAPSAEEAAPTTEEAPTPPTETPLSGPPGEEPDLKGTVPPLRSGSTASSQTTPSPTASPASSRPRISPTLPEQPSPTPPSSSPEPAPTPSAPQTSPRRPLRPPGSPAAQPKAATSRPKPAIRLPLKAILAALAQVGSVVSAKIRQGISAAAKPLGRLVQRTLPAAEEWWALPQSMMAFAALVIPLMVVAFSVTVFIRRGRAQQLAVYYTQGLQAYQAALADTDEIARYNHLIEAENALQQALAYGHNQEVEALESQVREALDAMDQVVRVDFQPLVNSLALRGRHLRRLALMSGQIFVLDETQGEVLRFRQTTEGYVYDEQFQCGPDQYINVNVGPLVDFVTVDPTLGKDYAVVAIDTAAHMVFCAPGAAPYARSLPLATTLPSSGRVLRLLNDQLYVFDPGHRALQVFDANEDFSAPPYNLFAGLAPEWLDQVTDFAVQRGSFFLLLRDGQVMRCDQPSPTSALDCQALTYHDPRPGRSDGPTLMDMRPVQLEISTIQEPTLFMLDSQGRAVYLLSFALAYSRQLRPAQPLAGPMTTFQIDANALPTGERMMYVAAGDQIYRGPAR